MTDELYGAERQRYDDALAGSVAPSDQAVKLSSAASRVRAVVR